MTFLPTLLSGNKNSERKLNHNQYIGVYLDQHFFSPPNKQSFKVKSEFKSRDHVSNSYTIIFLIFTGEKAAFFRFKQLPLNVKQKSEFLYHFIHGGKLLSEVVIIIYLLSKSVFLQN